MKKFYKKLLGTLCLASLALTPLSSAETLYGEDLAWRLANPRDIRQATSIDARLRKETKSAEPIFVLLPKPFDDIDPVKNRPGALPARPTQWEPPPFAAVGPPGAESSNSSRVPEDDANVWSELGVQPDNKASPSAALRPRVVPLDQQFVFRIKEIPKPFSLRRYFDRSDVFIELAAFGGTTSFKAEEAYRAMKEAATEQEPLEGVGREAFLTRLQILEEPEEPEEPELPPETPAAFNELLPMEAPRPDLADSSTAAALTAPAFQKVGVADLEGKHVEYVTRKEYRKKVPQVKNNLIVIVAFFPDEAVTLSFAIEERLGNVQDLVALALLAQRRLKDDIEKR